VLAVAYRELTGTLPRPAVLALLLAQSALETGHWKSIHNFNFGNQKAHPGYPMIVQFRCSEVINGVERFFDPPDPHCNFRAYNSAVDGALDYLRVLKNRPHWWQGLHTGDPNAFVAALATPPKYFTANPERYRATLVSLFHKYGPLAGSALQDPAMPPASPAQVAEDSSSDSLPPASQPLSTSAESAESETGPTDRPETEPLTHDPQPPSAATSAIERAGQQGGRSLFAKLWRFVLRALRAAFRRIPPRLS
jgi:hypothetical protein